MSVILDFAETGEDMVTLVANLARATQNRFDGQAGSVLSIAKNYIEAACFGFSALAACADLTEAQRLAASNIATGFREAMGIIATNFRGTDTYTSLYSLADRSEPERNAMEVFFGKNAPSMVDVSATAREAMDSLRRDPLDLMQIGFEGIRQLMGSVAAGVTVRLA
jgi:hypothetical protein